MLCKLGGDIADNIGIQDTPHTVANLYVQHCRLHRFFAVILSSELVIGATSQWQLHQTKGDYHTKFSTNINRCKEGQILAS
jgi:hypothetical protein